MSLFGQNPFKEFRATLSEKAQKVDEATEKYGRDMTQEDADHLCESKYHVCAVVVEHPVWGEGKPLMGRHAEPDDQGNVAWYDVEFAHGIEEKVHVDGLNILDEMSHGKKKKNEDNTNDKSDDGEGLDKVQPKAVKKKFKDRKDKDIDNDGDVDSSDEYLHKRRKAVSKSVDENEDENMDDKNGDEKKKMKKKNGEKDEVEMNPKMESRIRKALLDVLEANQNPNKDKAEKMSDKLKGKGAQDMGKDHEPKTEKESDFDEKGHDDASKAGKVTKPAAGRNSGDAVRSGDQKPVAPGTPMKKTMEAYAEVQEKWLKLHEPIDGTTEIDPDGKVQDAEEDAKE